ncbi:MAG: SUMF1/EgtB/PvdO family nonheme iron enzyme, partial [Planctomycetaceae bacterium]|nr:SUMF1/EgtB/PvdO family nonheme iron enzyme [Planctomycetaceae bacterium]
PGKRRIALLRPGFLPVPEREIVVEPAGRVVIPAPEWVPEVVVEAALPGLPPPPPAVLEAQRALRLPRGFVRTAEGRIFSEKDGAEMVLVAEGEFTMGSPANEDERPVHRPFLSSFLVDRHEVTTGQYRRFCEATNREFPRQEGEGFRKHPVTMVDWNDAAAYAAWAGRRLPSEAEWEKAARGTDGREYPWGNADDPALRNGEGGGDGFPQTSPGGAFPGGASPCGALDMAGNVWEWVGDWYDHNYYEVSPSENPHGPSQGQPMRDGKPYRVLRSGSWYNGQWGHSRVSNRNPSYYRGPDDPDHRWHHIGFRAVLAGGPAVPSTARKTLQEEPAGRNPGAAARAGVFVLCSPEVVDGGQLPKDYTGDGTSSTLPLAWSSAPEGTKSYALVMHHVAPDGEIKWYWVLYGIAPTVRELPKNARGISTLGNNSVNGRAEYAPPHSKGPGPKTYVYTIYALSSAPKLDLPPLRVNREVLLRAMKDLILASAELRVVYTRQGMANE